MEFIERGKDVTKTIQHREISNVYQDSWINTQRVGGFEVISRCPSQVVMRRGARESREFIQLDSIIKR